MFRRDAVNYAKKWFEGNRRKPLIIRGARQVGKSTLVRIFCNEIGLDIVEVNFEKLSVEEVNKEKNYSIERIIQEIELLTKKKIGKKSLLFFDEIQECPLLIAKLRYFYEERPDLPIIATGSLVEFVLEKHNFSMPVGRIQFFYLGPLSFFEFLTATENDGLRRHIEESFPRYPLEGIHNKLCELYQTYLFVGGMPEAIKTYIESNSLLETSNVHKEIVDTYVKDFAKYNTARTTLYLDKIFEFTPFHLGEKFKYSQMLENKSSELKKAIYLLAQARVLLKTMYSNCSGLPLSLGEKSDKFKLFFLDVGLTNFVQGLDWSDILNIKNKDNLSIGHLSEQFVAQHLFFRDKGEKVPKLHYWFRDKRGSCAEIDFVLKLNSKITPIEVKAGKTGTMRSLLNFVEEKKSEQAIRLDLAYRSEHVTILNNLNKTTLYNWPIYYVEMI